MKLKRILSTLLVACMIFGMLPATTFALDTSALHNYTEAEGYHLFTDLPTAENPTTTADIYWGGAFDGVFHGMTGNGFSSGSTTTTTDVAAMNKIGIIYGGEDATYGTYYYLTYTLPNGTAYTFAYGGGYFGMNELTDSLLSGGWQAKHKLFYNAEQHLFFHRPSADMTVMKALKISNSSFKFFTDTVAKVLASNAYPVRLYTVCTSNNKAGTNETHQWSGSCIYEGCETKFDYEEIVNNVEVIITDPAGYHKFDAANLPTEVGQTVDGLYLGAAFEENGTFYGLSSTSQKASDNSRYFETSDDASKQYTVSIRYAGKDETYGDYYNLIYHLPNGISYVLHYYDAVFAQNQIQAGGQPSGGFGAKHKLYFDADYEFFYVIIETNGTVAKKGLKISSSSHNFFKADVEDELQVASEKYSPVRLFEACAPVNEGGSDNTHHWSGTCSCGEKFDYEENYVVETRVPQENTPYFWGITQLDAAGQPSYFFNGEVVGTNLNVVKNDMLGSTPIYVEVVDGGYKLYFVNGQGTKQYIWYGTNETNTTRHFELVADAAAATVFGWNAEHTCFTVVVGTTEYYIGNYSDLNSDGSVKTAYTKISAAMLARFTHATNKYHTFAAKLYVNHMVHTYDAWDYDNENHWKACFCGKNEEKELHTLGNRVVEEGKIYRKCACGYAELEGTVPAVEAHSITLQENIAVNFFVNKAQFADGTYKDPYMVFVIGGQETKVADYKIRDTYFVFTFGDLTPDMMNETITANLYATVAEETALVSSDAYSVAQYCYDALRNEGSSDVLQTLLVETLNFGAAAQQYRNNNVENLANADLTDEERALGNTGALRELTSCRDFGVDNGKQMVKWYGVSLLMGNAIRMRIYFRAKNTEGLTMKVVGATAGEWVFTAEDFGTKDGMYYLDFDKLAPSQMGEELSFCVYNGETAVSNNVRYSMESYAAAWLSNDAVTTAQEELLKAMIRYGDAAKAYAERAFDLQEDVRYIGRTYEMDGAQWFNWSASGFSVQFQGSGLQAKIASNAPDAKNYAYLKVYVDGVEQTDILLDKTMQAVVLAEGLDANKTHTVEVRKRNSPRSSTAGLLSLEVLEGKKAEKPAAKEKLIEFVGDSLTVGYSAADANKTESAWSTKTEDGTKTYSKQVADAFGAEYMVTAISGRGVVMNNAGADGYLLPDIYPELDIYNIPGTAYDFQQQPDVVVINLGTNDATNTNLDMTVFQNGVVSFIKTVREKNPNAQIIWAYGLRKDNKTTEVAAAIAAAVAQINNEGDSKVYYLPLELAAQMHLNHPTAAAYAPSGEKLIEKITEITGW